MSTMAALRRRIMQALVWISIALFVVLVLVVMWQVFTRQVLHSPSGWTTTVSQYVFIWLVLFSVAMVFGERGHVAVDFFVRLLPRRGRLIAAGVIDVSVLLFSLLGLVWGGIRGMSISCDQAIPGLPVTVGQMYLALPVAGVLIALFALEDLLRAVRGADMVTEADAQTDAAIEAADAAQKEA